jgi:hypothetical protein
MPSIPAIRCKLVCSSSNGTPEFIEAADAVAVLPFAHVNAAPVSLQTSRECLSSHGQLTAAHADPPMRQQLHNLPVTRPPAFGDDNPSDNDFSLIGEVDIGR